MSAEAALTIALFSLALLPLVGVWGRVRATNRVVWPGVVALWLATPVALIWAALSYWQPIASLPVPSDRPIEVDTDGYVGSASCRTCHPHQHRTWHASYHRTMTQVATPETVLADFDNVRLEDGLSFRVIRRGDQFSVELPYPYEERPIVMTTGSHHMQVYWFPPHDGSRYLGVVPFAYLREEDRWLPRRTLFLQPPDLPTEFKLGHWNQGCIECHATNGKMRPTINSDGNWRSDQVDTQVAELGISCEACHGPGAAHVRANHDPTRRYAHHVTGQPDDTIVNPSRLSHELSSQVCGQCHSITAVEQWRTWALEGADFRPGQDLLQAETRFLVDFNAEPMRREVAQLAKEQPDFYQDHFWSDHTVRLSGREFNGLIESPCYQRGEMSCLSCHRLHPSDEDPRELSDWANDQLEQRMGGNFACLQCHQDFVGETQLTEHTHHTASSSGSSCYNCHMPYTAYGLLKAIRSHRIETPNVGTSVATGRPNACNQCHLDKTLKWSAEKLSDWYGIDQPELNEDQQTVAASVLWLLTGDAAQRALMAWSYGWLDAQGAAGVDWLPPYLIQLLEDPYHAIRFIAARSLRSIPGFADFEYEWPPTDERQVEDRKRGLAIWSRMEKDQRRSAVLVDPNGELLWDQFSRLLQRRNDRPVFVAE